MKSIKTMNRIAAAALAAGLLMGGSAAGAFATDESTGPAVEKSNNSLSQADATHLVILKPGGAPSSDRMGPPPANTGDWPVFRTPAGKVSGMVTPLEGTDAHPGPDGKLWRGVYVSDIQPGYASNSSHWWWIEEENVLSAEPKAVSQAAAKAAQAAVAAQQSKIDEQFTGAGTVTGSWYAEADETTEAAGFASFPGRESRLSEPFESEDGKQWRKMNNGSEVFYVLDSTVKNFKSDAELSASASAIPSAPSSSPAAEAPPIPEGMPGNAAPKGDASNAANDGADNAVAAADQPGNLGLMLGVGGVIVVGAGAYLYMQSKKQRKEVGAKAEATEDEPTD